MCYFARCREASIENIEAWMRAVGLVEPMDWKGWKFGDLNSFAHPFVPVLTNADPDRLQQFRWGLIPRWSKDETIAKHTANARLETFREKPSFRGSIENRCLVVIDGFYEWKWLDSKGKSKQKYLLAMPGEQPFTLGGLWSVWMSPSGERVPTFTVLTTEANELMAEIHNSKRRMPVIMARGSERDWLERGQIHCGDDQLMAKPV